MQYLNNTSLELPLQMKMVKIYIKSAYVHIDYCSVNNSLTDPANCKVFRFPLAACKTLEASVVFFVSRRARLTARHSCRLLIFQNFCKLKLAFNPYTSRMVVKIKIVIPQIWFFTFQKWFYTLRRLRPLISNRLIECTGKLNCPVR